MVHRVGWGILNACYGLECLLGFDVVPALGCHGGQPQLCGLRERRLDLGCAPGIALHFLQWRTVQEERARQTQIGLRELGIARDGLFECSDAIFQAGFRIAVYVRIALQE